MRAVCTECKKKFISTEYLAKHKVDAHPNAYTPNGELKRKGWMVGNMFVDFREPVTFAEAEIEASNIMRQAFMEMP